MYTGKVSRTVMVTRMLSQAGPIRGQETAIGELIGIGDGPAAENEMLSYLADAERQLLDIYHASWVRADGKRTAMYR